MNDQINVRLKRGSRFLLISVILQWFLSLTEAFGDFLWPVIFYIIFVLLSETSLSSTGWCSHVHIPVSAQFGQHLHGTGSQPFSARAGAAAKGTLNLFFLSPGQPAPCMLLCQMPRQQLHFRQSFVICFCALRSTVWQNTENLSVFLCKFQSSDGMRWGMGTALGSSRIVLLTSRRWRQVFSSSAGCTRAVSRGCTKASLREKTKKQSMEIGLLVDYLRKFKEKFRQELSLGNSSSLCFIVYWKTLQMPLPLILAFLNFFYWGRLMTNEWEKVLLPV